MKALLKSIAKALVLFLVGGIIYILVEILWRGYSHYSMFIVGGLCFLLVGVINEFYSYSLGLVWQAMIGSILITLVEFIAGLILNVYLGLRIWDYSNLPFNILGQVCLPFLIAWFFLAGIAIILDDYLRFWLFKEERPCYTLL